MNTAARRQAKPALVILLATLAAVLISLTAAQAATPPTWPSLSPSYRCDDGLAVFTLYNVGTDMQAGSQYYTATPHRVIEQGIFWLAAGGSFERVYNAPHIPLTFAYIRPDTGAWVELTQMCAGQATPTPTATPDMYAQLNNRWFLPFVTP